MPDQALVAFLRCWLPQLGLRWPGYRKVRGLVAKRLKRRLGELGVRSLVSHPPTLEELFLRHYAGDETGDGDEAGDGGVIAEGARA